MTSFLFWNVMGNDLRTLIARGVVEHAVDVLLLAEAGASDHDTVATLNAATNQGYAAISDENDKVRVFSRIPSNRWIRRQSDSLRARMAIWSIDVGERPGILLATAHFISKSNASDSDQALLATELAKEIGHVEDFVGHHRTVMVGDLNMNPFEPGLIGATTLHAVMTKQIAERIERVVQGTAYRFFYNPMWGHFGDRTVGPPGTYYHRSARVGELFWHMLDQVLLRPDLMHLLLELTILESIGGESLLTNPAGLPRDSTYSDHLPLVFRLNLD